MYHFNSLFHSKPSSKIKLPIKFTFFTNPSIKSFMGVKFVGKNRKFKRHNLCNQIKKNCECSRYTIDHQSPCITNYNDQETNHTITVIENYQHLLLNKY